MKKVFLALVIGALMPAASAAVLFEDAFDYPDGSLVSASAGKWTNHSGALGELPVLAGRAAVTQDNGEDVSAALAGGPYGPATNVSLYAAFTVNLFRAPSGQGGYFAHFKAGGTSGFCGKVFATTNGVPDGFYRLGVSKSSSTVSAAVFLTNQLSLNTDYQLLLRYAPATGNSVLWLEPGTEADPAAIATDSGASVSVVAFALRESLSGGNGMGGWFIDKVIVATSFAEAMAISPLTPPAITAQPQSRTATAGADVSFMVGATGSAPLGFQWRFNGTNLAGATDATLTLYAVTTNQSGEYSAVVTNQIGATNSAPASLTVNPAPPELSGQSISLLHYNVKGNGASDWSTNAAQVQAIGRQLRHLDPDIIDFNEIPNDFVYEMTNWVTAFLPGFSLATNSGTDGYIRSVIASRFPITRSRNWLTHVNLEPFGYSGPFTRDLFEAQVAVPGWPQPLHVFTTHLKAGNTATDFARRAAEAAAISNYFVTVYFTTNALHPYVLNGDLNEDIFRPGAGYASAPPVQTLISPPTGLQLTTPVNPRSSEDFTLSIQSTLHVRFDYILPCALLFSNRVSSQVFRTDLLNPLPPNLNANDDRVASDHLPVLMTFANPYDRPFRLLGVTRSNPAVTLTWQSVAGQPYQVEASSNLLDWVPLATSLLATNSTFTFHANVPEAEQYFRVHRIP